MAKKVIVGGRIESKEVGGIVTGAAEILDDTKGKKQNVINQETDAEMLRLDQSKQDNLTFDNIPTEGSDNPVKSGGLYTAQQAILLAIAAINELIPSAASALNQLADKAFVNSSISTNTATFRGTSAAGLNEQQFLAWANGLEHDLNDYVFWQTVDAAGNTLFKRYKWNGTEWAYEYTLNNSTFTAEQWEAIQSGITALLVTKLRALPTAQELIQSFDGKQDVLTFDNVPTLGSNNPVKSSGIYNVIKAITDLIPAEATAQNQLADKADVAAKIVAAIPSWKGQYDALTDLQAVTGAKAGDMGCVKTTDSDGHAVLTFYQYSAQGAWVVYYVLRHYAQSKPATTGTTGDYPYNGMGRIELQKNIVNGVNTLTQAMLTQQNTIYVIQYDFTLGEDITVPANCVLEFDGGSLSGAYTITGTNTGINAGLVKIFNTNVTLAGSWNAKYTLIDWFYNRQSNTTDASDALMCAIKLAALSGSCILLNGRYYISKAVELNVGNSVVVYGSKTMPTTTISENKQSFANFVFGENGSISVNGVSNITFDNVGFNGVNEGLILKSFRNKIINCGFNGFNKAIQIKQGENWVGENQIINCCFNSVENCIVLNYGSDGDINGCLVDGTCTTFITGGADSGFKIQNNHDYSEEGSTIGGYYTLFANNYIDGFKKLTVTGNSLMSIVGNLFMGVTNNIEDGDTETEKDWCIKFTSNTTTRMTVNSNTVKCGNENPNNLYFINVDDISYFNYIRMTGNHLHKAKLLTKINENTMYGNVIDFLNIPNAIVSLNDKAEIETCKCTIFNGLFNCYAKILVHTAAYADLATMSNWVSNNAFSVVQTIKIGSRPDNTYTAYGKKITMPADYAMENTLEVWITGYGNNYNVDNL